MLVSVRPISYHDVEREFELLTEPPVESVEAAVEHRIKNLAICYLPEALSDKGAELKLKAISRLKTTWQGMF